MGVVCSGPGKLRACTSAGEALPADLGRRFSERFGVDTMEFYAGTAHRARTSISPGPLVPISTTIPAAPSGRASSVSGTPMWLFRLPTVWWIDPSGDIASAIQRLAKAGVAKEATADNWQHCH